MLSGVACCQVSHVSVNPLSCIVFGVLKTDSCVHTPQAFLYMAGGNDYVVRRYGLSLDQLVAAWDASDHSTDFLPTSVKQLRSSGWTAWYKFLLGIDKVAGKVGRGGAMVKDAIEMYTFYTQVAWCYFYQGDTLQADILETTTDVDGRIYREWPWRRDEAGCVTREGACVIPPDLRGRVDPSGVPDRVSVKKPRTAAASESGTAKKRRTHG